MDKTDNFSVSMVVMWNEIDTFTNEFPGNQSWMVTTKSFFLNLSHYQFPVCTINTIYPIKSLLMYKKKIGGSDTCMLNTLKQYKREILCNSYLNNSKSCKVCEFRKDE